MRKLLLLFMLLVFNFFCFGKVIFVNSQAKGANNGISWSNAYTNLEVALTNAQRDDTLWVAKGIYTPGDKTDREASFKIYNVTFFGGFAGTENTLSQRNYILNETVLNGNIGEQDDATDNCYSVVELVGGTLDGVIVTNGYGNNSNGYKIRKGGGIEVTGSPTIRNCVFYNNYSENGGAVGYEDQLPRFENCKFISNSAKQGGAVFQKSAFNGIFPNFVGCLFNNNTAEEGGAIYSWKAHVGATNCTFVNNSNCLYIYDYNKQCDVEFLNTIFYNNGEDDSFGASFSISGSNHTREWTYCLVPPAFEFPDYNVFTYKNINDNPGFVNPDGKDGIPGTVDDDYRLSSDSPARNTGKSSLGRFYELDFDFYGNLRVYEELINIGAFETYDLTGNTEIAKCNIKIFPNPTNELIHINLGATYNEVTVDIRNMNGRSISNQFYEQATIIEQKIAGAPGIYFITVYEKGKKLASVKTLKIDDQNTE